MRGRSQAAGSPAHRTMLGLSGLLAQESRQVASDGSIGGIGQPNLGQAHLPPLRHVLAGNHREKTFAQDAVDILAQQFRFDGATH